MAQEASDASVASSSPAPNWWDIHANPLSWNAMNRWPLQNPRSANSCEEDISVSAASFTNNTSNHSGPSLGSSSADLSEEPAENHLWSQVLLSVGSRGELQNSHDDGENFLDVLSSKTLATEMFDPACDYLKKLDSSWELTNPSTFNTLEQLNSYSGSLVDHKRLTNLSDLVSNWSIAPPNPRVDHQIAPSTCNAPSMTQYSTPDNISHIKPDWKTGFMPYMHGIKEESQHHDIGASEPSYLRSFNNHGIGYQIGLNNSEVGLGNKFSNGSTDGPWCNTRSLSDHISFSGCLNKPAAELRPSKPSMKGSDSSEGKKQGHETSSSTRGSGRGSGATSERKKKRSEDNSDALLKKSKLESSAVSPLKLQAPKVKLGDRITALQQIVSPFGKTDTASVLFEAINYIRYLHEQVELLSDPYMKSSANKDRNSWVGLERKDKAESNLDLRSRGLCLVPISWTSKIYHDNTGPDYWAPPFRGPMFR